MKHPHLSASLFVVLLLAMGAAFSCTPIPDHRVMSNMNEQRQMMDTSMIWSQMDHGQRLEFMKQVVMPKMRAEFAAFDPNQYGKINCMTCHGDGAHDGSFKMPNPKLYKLPKTSEGFSALMNEKPKIFQFMAQTVKPKMAALLHMPAFDPATHTGFGCGNCHTSE